MAKIPMKKLVSLIIEQINAHDTLNQLFPPDKDVYIDSPAQYPELFQKAQDQVPQNGEQPRGIERKLEPQVEPEMEPELAMVAESELKEARGFEYDQEKLAEPIKILAEELTKGARSAGIPNIVCLDPVTNEMVEGTVIGDIVLTTPSGKKVLVFYNYGLEQKIDRSKKKANYVVLADNRFMMDKPRGKEWGKEIPRNVQGDLEQTLEDLKRQLDQATDRDEQNRLSKEIAQVEGRLTAIREGNAKRYALFPLINKMFSDPGLLDLLDISLIPETWATPPRTEHTQNVVRLKKFGGTSAEIDADFYAVRDLDDVESAIDEVMELRADLAMGDIDQEQGGATRDREVSKSVPRRHANYIYQNGNWFAKQRVHDENFFEREGGKTPVYELLSKNIQEGNKGVTIESHLDVKGYVQGNEYLLKSTFTAELSARNPETGKGEVIGQLFEPVVTGLRKPLVDDQGNPINPENFTLENNTTFFVNEGRTVTGSKTGYMPDFFNQTAENIKQVIDPDEVYQTMVDLVQKMNDQEGDVEDPLANL